MHTHTHTHINTHTHTLTLKFNKGKEVQLQQFTGGYLAGGAAAGWSGRAGPGRWAETPWSEVPAPTDTACATSLPPSALCRCSCTSLTHQTSTTLPLGLLQSDTANHTHWYRYISFLSFVFLLVHYYSLFPLCLPQHTADVFVLHWHATDVRNITTRLVTVWDCAPHADTGTFLSSVLFFFLYTITLSFLSAAFSIP